MSRKIASGSAGFLTYAEIMPIGTFYKTVKLDSEEWSEWLDRELSFSYDAYYQKFTVRAEKKQRGFTYWYAYARIGDKVSKHYIGKHCDVTSERLNEVGLMFKEDRRRS